MKIGDKVKIIKGNWGCCQRYQGKTGEITKFIEGFIRVKVKGMEKHFFRESQLEIIL